MGGTASGEMTAGDDVFGADGRKIGTIAEVHRDYVVVEKEPTCAVDDIIAGAAAATGESVDQRGLADVVTEDEVHIPLLEEEIVATIRPAEGGVVRIEKRIVRNGQVVDVAVPDEQIRIERHIVDRPVNETEVAPFEQIIIELRLDDDFVSRQTQGEVSEEIIVSKETQQRTERVTGTVRREELTFDEGRGVPSSNQGDQPALP